MMNVIVNGRFLSRPITGVERYAREILCRLGSPRLRAASPTGQDGLRGYNKPKVIRSEGRMDGARGHFWEQVVLPGQIGPDHLLWSPANTGPVLIEHQVLTLHDLSPLEHPEWFRPAFGLWYQLFVPVLVRRVRRIVVSSEFVRAKLIKRFNLPAERVTVIPGGVDMEIFCPDAPRTMALPERYVLFVGSLQPRKNLPRLLDAWGQMKDAAPDAWLVIAGAGSKIYNPVKLEVVERVRFLGAVTEADLPGLYASAALCILPSLDEGFGLPVLEAMASGIPVAASRAGALPEVLGDPGLSFDPLDVAEIADSLRRGLLDAALRESLCEQGLAQAQNFSWDNSADMLWKVFEGCN